VRAVAGEKTAFAYSDDISEAALLDAARTVRTIAAAGQSRRVKVGTKSSLAASRVLYAPMDPIATLDSTQKVALLEKIEKMARARDPRIVQVMAGLGHDRFAVCGHDRGGRVAYRMALDHPDRVSAVAVLDVVPTGEVLDDRPLVLELQRRTAHQIHALAPVHDEPAAEMESELHLGAVSAPRAGVTRVEQAL